MKTKTIFKRLIAVILFGLFCWICLLFWSVYSTDSLPLAKSNNQLRVLSMNVSTGNILDDSLQNDIILSNPDIITIIEWTGNNINLSKFRDVGYKVVLDHPRKKVHGLCILSKFEGQSSIVESPIETPCALPIGQFHFKWQDHFITLFAVHAPPPVPDCKGTTNDYLIAVSDWIKDGYLSRNVGSGKEGDLAILAGDFNSISLAKGIRQLKKKGLNDEYSLFTLTGQTWKPFKYFPPVAKIDYILFANKFSATNTVRFNINNSDHLGLQADLEFK
jgi:endonuclease/exonuclease/phosphatase (EEP) superfamily protein YafD